jgi:carbamoyltransferase
MANKKFSDLFGKPVRKSESDLLTQFHMDVAASEQAVKEEVVIQRPVHWHGIPSLCLTSGVSLNCFANGKIHRDKSLKKIYVQPIAGDAGGALGAALSVWQKEMDKPRKVKPTDSIKGSYLEPSYLQQDIEKELINCDTEF